VRKIAEFESFARKFEVNFLDVHEDFHQILNDFCVSDMLPQIATVNIIRIIIRIIGVTLNVDDFENFDGFVSDLMKNSRLLQVTISVSDAENSQVWKVHRWW
jgi:hypothetical protein